MVTKTKVSNCHDGRCEPGLWAYEQESMLEGISSDFKYMPDHCSYASIIGSCYHIVLGHREWCILEASAARQVEIQR